MRNVLMLTAICAFTVVAQADGVRDSGRAAVSFRLASQTAADGFEATSLGREGTIYVSKHAVLSADDVSAVETIAARVGSDVELSLSPDVAARLADSAARIGADMLAIYVGNKLTGAGSLTILQADGLATITGLDPNLAERVTSLIRGTAIPGGPTITLTASSDSIVPGGEVTIEAYLHSVPNLRTYQITLATSGGTSGRIAGTNLWIDSERADFVFGTEPKLDAVDQFGGRLGGVLMSGSVDATRTSYLGSFTLRASDDASGTFTIDVKTGGRSSIVWTSENKPVNFGTRAATVSVGAGPRVKKTKN